MCLSREMLGWISWGALCPLFGCSVRGLEFCESQQKKNPYNLGQAHRNDKENELFSQGLGARPRPTVWSQAAGEWCVRPKELSGNWGRKNIMVGIVLPSIWTLEKQLPSTECPLGNRQSPSWMLLAKHVAQWLSERTTWVWILDSPFTRSVNLCKLFKFSALLCQTQ